MIVCGIANLLWDDVACRRSSLEACSLLSKRASTRVGQARRLIAYVRKKELNAWLLMSIRYLSSEKYGLRGSNDIHNALCATVAKERHYIPKSHTAGCLWCEFSMKDNTQGLKNSHEAQ